MRRTEEEKKDDDDDEKKRATQTKKEVTIVKSVKRSTSRHKARAHHG